MKDKRIIAAFDFDGTLTTKDSFIEFAKYTVGGWRLLTACVAVVPWLVAWKLHLCSGGYAKERLFGQLYKGMPERRFKECCNTFLSRISGLENDKMVDRMKWHLEQGDAVYIVSASVPGWIAPWANTYGIGRDHILGTEIEVDGNRNITGRFVSPNCTGAEKIRRLKAVVPELDAATLYAYGDSSGDRQLLEAADYPTYIQI